MTASSQEKAQPVLEGARAILRNAGLNPSAIEEQFSFPAEGQARGDDILELAKESKCDTVVVGSESLSWPKQLLDNDPVEELIVE